MTMQQVTINRVSLEYETRGSGEPLVLSHCSLHADGFAPLMNQPVLTNYRLIRYHRRGYAGSSRADGPVMIPDQAADLAGLLGHLSVGPAHIVGHAYAGWIVAQLALDRPDLVATLVLMEPPLLFRADTPATQAVSQALSQRVAAASQCYREGDREGAVDAADTLRFGPGYRELLERVLPGSWAQAVQDADMFFGIELPAWPQWRFGVAEARRITVPVLSLSGGESDPPASEYERLLQASFPQVETVRVPEVNHLLHLRQPQLVAEALASFLARHPLS
jgi:pimeloyl-ACP methyl ester carboxylesterase